jgi:hypothetical protein
MNIGRYFIAGLLAFGVIVGLALLRFPQLGVVPVAAFTLPLALAFLLDLVLMPLSRQGRIEPVTMEQRFLGVIGSALVAMGIAELAR